MSNKKYELLLDKSIEVAGRKLYRIRALISFGIVTAGDEGGYIEKEDNLSSSGDAWVSGNAWVYGTAWVYGNAWVYGDAQVYGDARVYGNAWVYGNAQILFFSKVGSSLGTLTAFRNKDQGITVTRGCFIGSLVEFRAAVKKTHGGTEQEKGYGMIADYIEFHFTTLHPAEEQQ